jgi:holliday junction DNA helicase RuvA
MYAHFTGKVIEKEDNNVVLEVNNIGYNIYMCTDELESINEEDNIKLYTYFKVREDEQSLYGFLTKSRLEFFKKLTSVSGVGSKVAISIISNISVEEMCNAIITENILLLKSIPGIGPKMAGKIIFELKEKIGNINVTKTVKNNNNNLNEAISALKVLGYMDKDLKECVNELDIKDKTVEEIVKLVLKNIQKKGK